MKNDMINYNQLTPDHVTVASLPDLQEVGESWRFFTAPTRTPANLNEDRNLCRRINSISSTFISVYFDDFWGKGVRRDQFFIFSLSAPHCEVLNLKPTWWNTTCMSGTAGADANISAACHKHLLDNFQTLQQDQVARIGVVNDPGAIGKAFIKCKNRPFEPFQYITDLMVMQIQAYVYNFKRSKLHATDNVEDLCALVRQHRLTAFENQPFVLPDPWVGDGATNNPLLVGFSSKKLLQNLRFGSEYPLHVDGTFKLTKNGFPAIVV
ncbi:TPA: hypothetical protein N0F65_009794, partial [Lagenidium giganteum]